MSSNPAPIVIEAASLLRPGRALDLACGGGRNARHLRERGWTVIGVDWSIDAACDVLADLERDDVPFGADAFDLVLNIRFLHRPLFRDVARVLRPGGIFVADIHIRGINPRYCVKPGELREIFAEWDTVTYRESDTAELIARLPLNN